MYISIVSIATGVLIVSPCIIHLALHFTSHLLIPSPNFAIAGYYFSESRRSNGPREWGSRFSKVPEMVVKIMDCVGKTIGKMIQKVNEN